MTRDDHRTLFDLAPRVAAEPLPGWRPHLIAPKEWGALFTGDATAVPAALLGARITVTAASGKSWTATVSKVLERDEGHVLVRTSRD